MPFDDLWLLEKCKDIKGVTRSCKSKKTDNTMAKNDKRNLPNTTQKTKDCATLIPLKSGDELICSGN